MKYLDLFCGAGGMSCGLRMAGLTPLGGIDSDAAAIKTYRANHPGAIALRSDIRELTSADILGAIGGEKPGLICGGPPCQGFSTLGKNDADDPRNRLVREFVRVVADLEPDRILVENVPGLMAPRHRETLEGLLDEFRALGYALDVKVLTASDYGVPQRRRRTIILGNRAGVSNVFPEPEGAKVATVGDAFEKWIYKGDGTATDHDPVQIKDPKDLERLQFIPQGGQIRYERDQDRYELPRHLRYPTDWQELPECRFREAKLHRLDLRTPANTINTRRTTYYHPTEHRNLTLREAAAIQSFPPDYEFRGTPTQKWRQVGNAVPPLLARAIGRTILEVQDETR